MEKVRRKKMQVCEKVGKSRFTLFFQWFVAPEGRKVTSLKRRVRSQLARREIKSARRCGAKHISKSKCTKHARLGPLLEVEMSKKCKPLWREAHFHVKMYKAREVRTTLEVEMSKKCTPLWREAHFQVKMYKAREVRTTFGSWDVEKVHAVVARSTFPSQNVQNTGVRTNFWKLKTAAFEPIVMELLKLAQLGQFVELVKLVSY